MLKIIYQIIAALILLFTIIDLVNERNWRRQLTHLLIIVPLVLRVLLIK